jgi:hypothetical protein
MTRFLTVATLLVVSSASSLARAEGDPAAAMELFRRGRELVSKGEWKEGCAQFQASMDMFPSIGALLNIAECREHEGKLASALSAYVKAGLLNQKTSDEKERAEVSAHIDEKSKALRPRVPMLTIQIATRPKGLRVTRDGEEVPSSALGTALPTNPGKVTIEASALGMSAREEITLPEGASKTVALELRAAGPATGGPGDAPATRGVVPAWAWATGAIGLVAGGVGIGFAIDYASAKSKAKEICGGNFDSCVPSDPSFDVDSFNARKNRDVGAGIAFGVVGGALVTAAIVGIARGGSTAPREQAWSLSPWLGQRSGGVELVQRF